jgi:Ca-activated chloride channel homolog
MKRKCLGFLVISMLIFTCFQFFSGCQQKKVEIQLKKDASNNDLTISGVIYPSDNGQDEYAEDSMEDYEEARRGAIDGPDEFTLEEIVITKAKGESSARRRFREESDIKRRTRSLEKLKLSLKDTALGSELWIIEKNPSVTGEEYKTESPKLVCSLPGQSEVILPLEHTSVDARISGYIATVNVLQKYHNPYTEKIEAVYVFPLPQNAAVTDFVMIIGDRKIRGLIREKEEAQRIYQAAKEQGYRASLLTQERPNIFKQSVANIEPGKRIDISITFFNPLKYDNGEFEFVFPTVVGPRFNPPGSNTGIGAVGRGAHTNSGQETDVHYLKPDESSGHDISINVDIDAGVSIENVYSNSHVIKVNKNAPSHAIVSLSPNDSVPNKDFVLRYKTSGKEVKTAMMVHKGEKGTYFSLLLQPPDNLKNLPRIPREMVFVMDCSGSMDGEPIAKAKEAVRRALKNLDKNDSFQIIQFSSSASSLGPDPIQATPANVKKGLQYLDSLYSEGGTMMIEGIKAALDFPHDKRRLRIVSFMTDGFIGNEYEILAAIHEKLGESRIFSFGVGSSVNRYLLEQMALMGRGAVAYVGLDESAGETVDRFYDVATHPAMANIDIDWGNLEVEDLYPKRIPDLFVGRPIMITGKLKNTEQGRVRINGQVGKDESYFDVAVDPNNSEAKHAGIQSVWARNKIAELSNRETYNPSDRLKNEIIATSINYNLISQHTAFLAVDSLERTEGDHGYTVDVPVPVPDGVKYGTTVTN